MRETKRERMDKPENRECSDKFVRMVITPMEKRIRELKKVIKETNKEFVRKLCSQELDLVQRRIKQFKENPSGRPFDEFAPLTDYSK